MGKTKTLVVFSAPEFVDQDFNHIDHIVYFLPPARSGDLLQCLAINPSAILLIDTIFMRGPQPSYEEVHSVLKKGIAVYGAARIGAFWANDLSDEGMQGLGTIYEMIQNGSVTDYHEVCAPNTTEGPQPLTFIEIQLHLKKATDLDLIKTNEARSIIEAIRCEPICHRSTKTILNIMSSHIGLQRTQSLEDQVFNSYMGQCSIDAVSALQSVLSQLSKDKHKAQTSTYDNSPISKITKELETRHRSILQEGQFVQLKDILDSYRLHYSQAKNLHKRAAIALLRKSIDPDMELSENELLQTFASRMGITPKLELINYKSTVKPKSSTESEREFEEMALSWLELHPQIGLDEQAMGYLSALPEFTSLVKRHIQVQKFNDEFKNSPDFRPEWLEEEQLREFYGHLWGVNSERFSKELRLRGFRSHKEFRQIATQYFIFDKLVEGTI